MQLSFDPIQPGHLRARMDVSSFLPTSKRWQMLLVCFLIRGNSLLCFLQSFHISAHENMKRLNWFKWSLVIWVWWIYHMMGRSFNDSYFTPNVGVVPYIYSLWCVHTFLNINLLKKEIDTLTVSVEDIAFPFFPHVQRHKCIEKGKGTLSPGCLAELVYSLGCHVSITANRNRSHKKSNLTDCINSHCRQKPDVSGS